LLSQALKKYNTKNHNSDENDDDDEHCNYAIGKSDEEFEY